MSRSILTTCLRVAGFGLLFTGVARSLGAPWPQALCVGMAAMLIGVVERRIARSSPRHAPSGPGPMPDHEGQRAAEVRRMTLELACDRSQSVLGSLGEGVLVVDGGGEIVLANPAARSALERPYSPVIGRVFWEVLADGMAKHAREAWQKLRELRELREMRAEAAGDSADAPPQIRLSSIACRDRIYDLTAVPVKSAETGQDFGTVFLFVDTTRNHELQQLKDRFLSSISHELRTPLTNICAYSEILGTLLPGESMEWPEFVKVIHEESVQLSRLVDGMFDYLQLECGESSFRSEWIDGGEVAQAVTRTFVPVAAARGIDLKIVERPCARKLELDRSRLEQVCRHLLDNAIKFTPVGGTVHVEFGEVENDFELRVDDSGPGVPIADRAAAFEKFTQLNDHLTDKPAGAGLGLATCRTIVSRFGGLIWCEDSPLGGAGFVMRLPLPSSGQQAPGQPRSRQLAGEAGSARPRSPQPRL